MIKSSINKKTNPSNLKYTLQIHILLVFLTLLIVTFTSILTYSYIENTKANIDLGKNVLDRLRRSLIERINISFSNSQIFSNFGSQLYNTEKEVEPKNAALIGLMREILRNYPYLTSVYTGTKSGKFVQILRVNHFDTYRSDKSKTLPARVCFAIRHIDLSATKVPETWIYEDQDRKILDTEIVTKSSFDHRNLKWYQLAEKNKTVSWSEVYIDHVNHTPCITVSTPTYNEISDGFIGVFGLDLGIDRLSDFLREGKVAKDRSVFIVNSKGEIVANSEKIKSTEEKNNNIEMTTVNNLTNSSFKEAYRLFESNQNNIFSFEYNSINYIASFSSFPKIVSKEAKGREISSDDFSKDWVIGIVTPVDEFVGSIKTTQKNILLISILLFIATALILNILAKHVSKPIMLLAEEANKIRKFNLTGTVEIKSHVYELKMLNEAIFSMHHSMEAFSKFIPKVLVGKLLKNNHKIQLGGKNELVTFLFTDIADFSTICETYPAGKLSTHLSDYFEEVTKIIFTYNGLVDKYIGDAVMAFWGAPVKDKDQALNACKAALSIEKKLAVLNQQWASQDKPVFNTRIGVHIGEAIVGNMGSSERINYTALGDAVNIAARLESTNKLYHSNIIISEDTMRLVNDSCLTRPLDVVTVKGKNKSITIYELVGLVRGEPSLLATKKQIELCDAFTKAYQLYQEKNWAQAYELFYNISKKFQSEYMVGIYIKRCKEFMKNPPPHDWNGLTIMKEK